MLAVAIKDLELQPPRTQSGASVPVWFQQLYAQTEGGCQVELAYLRPCVLCHHQLLVAAGNEGAPAVKQPETALQQPAPCSNSDRHLQPIHTVTAGAAASVSMGLYTELS